MRAMNAVKTVVWITLFAGMSVAESGGSGTFTDKRDGKTYKTVAIGGRTWMAENLSYQPQTGKSWCYENKKSNCAQYGRLYDWNTAKTACPSGWHLPSSGEWDGLFGTAGGKKTAGKKLKSTSGWNSNGNGTDDFGFSALPGGSRSTDGYFNDAGYGGYWWTATEDDASYAYNRYMGYGSDYVVEYVGYKEDGFAVRCVRD